MPVFYLDENLHGAKFSQVLIDAGIDVRLCANEGRRGVADAIWIPEIARRDWVIVTGDVRTRHDPWEKAAIVRAKARMIHVRNGKHTTHPILAQNFVNTYARILSFVEGREPPYLATLTRPSKQDDFFRGRPGRLNPQSLDDVTK